MCVCVFLCYASLYSALSHVDDEMAAALTEAAVSCRISRRDSFEAFISILDVRARQILMDDRPPRFIVTVFNLRSNAVAIPLGN